MPAQRPTAKRAKLVHGAKKPTKTARALRGASLNSKETTRDLRLLNELVEALPAAADVADVVVSVASVREALHEGAAGDCAVGGGCGGRLVLALALALDAGFGSSSPADRHDHGAATGMEWAPVFAVGEGTAEEASAERVVAECPATLPTPPPAPPL